MGERKKAAVRKPCGGRNKGIGARKNSRNVPGCPCSFLSPISEMVIIFDMLHYILDIAMQDIT